jgi:hypothetical protein
MEEGLAREVTACFITPPPENAPEARLLIERSQDHSHFLLTSEEGDALLLARVVEKGPEEGSVEMWVPTGGDPPTAVGPAFTLSHAGNGDTWTLSCTRCECCEYLPPTCAGCGQQCKRHLMYIRQSPETVHGCKVMHMEAEIPPLRPDGKPAIWCTRPRAAGESPRGSCSAPPEAAFAGAGQCLESWKPRWSTRLQSLTQDFYGRCDRASAKNIQMGLASATPRRCDKQRPELLHGKIGDNHFCLDYRQPLSMVQAFALALSTKNWD